MSYQALLFCADEKLARVVTQVFTELEFNVELVNEPFAAVKKLMAQHYDALVVDCDNDQNASLLFKSARNSNTNQTSLALALVEGQAGVAKAYRIGANLVLTKPINVEQAKGTLRVARGLLRKSADAAATTQAPHAAPAPKAIESFPKPSNTAPKPAAFQAAAVQPAKPAAQPMPAPAAPTVPSFIETPAFEEPEFETAMPAAAASTKPESIVADKDADSAPAAIVESTKPKIDFTAPAVPKPQPTPVTRSKTFGSFGDGAAAAPAPAKEIPATRERKASAGSELFDNFGSNPHTSEVIAPPTFSMGEEPSGSGKKFALFAVAAVLLAALAYFGWTKFGSSGKESAQEQVAAPKPAVVTGSAPTTPGPSVPEPAQKTATLPTESTPTPVTPQGKPHAALNIAPATKTAVVPAEQTPKVAEDTYKTLSETKKPSPAAIQVKTSPSTSSQASSDDAVALPNPLAVTQGSDNTLANLVSEKANMPVAPVGTLKISQGVSQGLLIKKVQPSYPMNAQAMRLAGAVQLEALIDKEGKIKNLKVIKGDMILAKAAVDAVKQWRYKPYYLNGEPVEIQTQITVMFKLPN